MNPLLQRRGRFAHCGRPERNLGTALRDIQQRFGILDVGDVARRQHTRVAIDFDREPQAPPLPPQRQIPWHQHDSHRCSEQQQRIACLHVLALVRECEPPHLLISAQQPLRHDDLRAPEANDRWTDVSRDEHVRTVESATRPRGGSAIHAQPGDRKAGSEQRGTEDPHRAEQRCYLLRRDESIHAVRRLRQRCRSNGFSRSGTHGRCSR